ncbi:MAG TPA: hypothetical protein VFK58_04850 [Sphingomicrobium sp.]|nr:hypothetical protein [Sphingomicrobium sp.]
MGLARCVTLWIGERLGPVERACFRSVVRQGHELALYCYRPPAGIPVGVEVRDASVILDEEVLRDRCGSRPDLYSDWFRYELMRRGLGTWLDADVYVVGPIEEGEEHLFGWQSPDTINNAVLRLPADSPLLPELLEPFERQTTPRWMPWRCYVPLRLRELLTGRADLTRVPWGSTSPQALTALARKHGLDALAQPQDCFYPMPWQQAGWILDPALPLEDVITDVTVAVHLWNECIRSFKEKPAPPGSFLRRLQDEGR